MPDTEAGKRLLIRMTTRSTADISPPEVAIAAIEAEAVAAERARITREVEESDELRRNAVLHVLAIVNGADR